MVWDCSFRGELHFLSNFYPSPFILDGVHYPTVEHYFQAMKTQNLKEREKIINAPTPTKAKMIGKKCTMRSDWNSIKVEVMFHGVFAKFDQNKELKEKLLNTPDHLLVEKNNWGDKFWGVDIDTGYGLNKMGDILKQVKAMLGNGLWEEVPKKKESVQMLFKKEDVVEEKVMKMYKFKDGSVIYVEV